MRILALEPYYGGSHEAFLSGWISRSRHEWEVLSLPPHKWKWRMRHAAITLAYEVSRRLNEGYTWDRLFCSDMLNLAEFRGLVPEPVRQLPNVVYFHENQLTYPVRHETERDYHYVLTNLTTALAADRTWFNSGFHRDEFLGALPGFLKRMPDYQPYDAIDKIRAKTSVHPPGVEDLPARGQRKPGPTRILWAARWEHDKNPQTFFEAVGHLQASGIDFHLSVIGEQFRESPAEFEQARRAFAERIDHWGYQASREDYLNCLYEADIVVSTALHEFFGISVVEAAAAGAFPLLPRRLSYPEIFGLGDSAAAEEFFYDGSARHLAARIRELNHKLQQQDLWSGDLGRARRMVERFFWRNLVPEMDDALEHP